MISCNLLLVAFVAGTAATFVPGGAHSIHEKRTELPNGWTQGDPLDPRTVLPMRIGLKQRNLHKVDEWLTEVSHPKSDKYGQHWTAKDVAEAFAPSDETVEAIKTWLVNSGVTEERIKYSQSRAWIELNALVGEAEALFHTKYHMYDHMNGQQHVATTEYSVPAHLKQHIDLVSPTVHFDVKPGMPSEPDAVKRQISKREKFPGLYKGLGAPGSGSLPKGGFRIGGHHGNMSGNLATCDEFITPDCLRALYKLPVNKNAAQDNSYGIVEYTPQAYVPSDLDLFFANFSPKAVGQRPIFDSIDGGVVQQTNMSFDFNGESDLDLEYAISLVYPQKVTLYQVGDLVEGASFNNFLDAIDGSYCTYEGGDDSSQDGIYPDVSSTAGYQGPENCGGFAATKVISTSYAYNEHDLTPFYEMRQCNEYAKLGLLGVSVLYSSGDYGVAGNGGQCINGPGLNATYNNGNSGRFNPSFPGTCPYVTSVGATQVKPNTTITTALATGVQPEEACETVIYSGGGFSNVFALPDYQATAVQGFFADYPPPYGPDRYNNSQQTRGFPDISANGANYVIAIDGNFSLVYGTSASSPTLGSVLTLINQERLQAGKGSIGFINPVAYAHPEVFNDISAGTNQGCGTVGFSSVPGWDPVTGLGTPNYPEMLKLWLSLD